MFLPSSYNAMFARNIHNKMQAIILPFCHVKKFISILSTNKYMSKCYFGLEFGAYEFVCALQVTSNW